MAILLGACALTLGACSSTTGDSSSTTNTVQQPPLTQEELSKAADREFSASWQKENFSSFYNQKIDWKACTAEDGLTEEITGILEETGQDSTGFECGFVDAPLNWGDPSDTRTVSLAVTRIPTTGNPDDAVPLFTNPGGPGIGGVQHAMLLVTNPAFLDVLSNHELWGFDPRGVGGSSPVTCDYDSDLAAVQVAECANSAPVGHFMGTSQVARDMELLRYLAGDKRLDYVGYSYGSMLGATYATLFPDNAGRMILDSAENAQWGTLNHNFDQAVAVSKAVGTLADSCTELTLEDGSAITCPFTSEKEMLEWKKQLDDKPMKATDGTEITGRQLRDFLTSTLYNAQVLQGSALDLLAHAKEGDQQAIDDLAVQIAESSAEIDTTGQLIVCPSTPKTLDVAGLIDHMKQVGVPEFLGGPEITDDLLSEYTEFDCAALPETGTDITTSFDATGTKTKLMVIGITGDHATPYAHGQELARQLGNATFVTLEGTGHGASFSDRSSCIDQVAADYLIDGTVPEDGTVCAEDELSAESSTANEDTSTGMREQAATSTSASS